MVRVTEARDGSRTMGVGDAVGGRPSQVFEDTLGQDHVLLSWVGRVAGQAVDCKGNVRAGADSKVVEGAHNGSKG